MASLGLVGQSMPDVLLDSTFQQDDREQELRFLSNENPHIYAAIDDLLCTKLRRGINWTTGILLDPNAKNNTWYISRTSQYKGRNTSYWQPETSYKDVGAAVVHTVLAWITNSSTPAAARAVYAASGMPRHILWPVETTLIYGQFGKKTEHVQDLRQRYSTFQRDDQIELPFLCTESPHMLRLMACAWISDEPRFRPVHFTRLDILRHEFSVLLSLRLEQPRSWERAQTNVAKDSYQFIYNSEKTSSQSRNTCCE